MLNQCLCLLILLFSVGFFRLAFLPVDIVTRWMSVFGLLLCFAVLFLPLHRTNNNNPVKANFTYPIGFMMLAVFLSMLPCYFDWGQSFKITLVAQRGAYFLILYFVLHKLSLTKEQFLQVLTVFAAMYLIVFAAQYLMWPRPVVYMKHMLDDIRVFNPERERYFGLPGIRIVLLFFYMKLCDFVKTSDKKALIWLGVLFIHFIIVQTRSYIFPIMAIATFAIWATSRERRSMFVKLSYIFGALLILVFAGGIIYSLIGETREQVIDLSYTRFQSLRYFTVDFSKSMMGYVLGNGMDSLYSAYGETIYTLKVDDGFYQSDIGIIGDYSRFGVVFILALYFALIRIIKYKGGITDVKLFALHMLLIPTAFQFSAYYETIVAFCLMCYLCDRYKSGAKKRFCES